MRAKEIVAMLREYRYRDENFGVVTEFRPAVGWSGAENRIDMWAIARAPSKGMQAHSIEIKVSRGDWLKELKQPLKQRLALAISNYMWMAAPTGLIKPEELPHQWGLLEVDPDTKDDWYRVKQKHPAEYRDKVRPTWGLVTSLIRGLQKDL